MKIIKFLTFLIAGACSLQACHNSEKSSNSSTIAPDSLVDTVSTTAQSLGGKLTEYETTFIQQAAIGGMMEVQAGNLALQKSKNPEIKKFAQMMVTDHMKANTELDTLAKSKGLGLPVTFPVEDQKHADVMKTLVGDAFDRHYMRMMVTDHNKTIDLFNQAKTFQDADIRNFAAKTLPVLEGHYRAGIRIDSVMQSKKMGNGDDILNLSTGTDKKNN